MEVARPVKEGEAAVAESAASCNEFHTTCASATDHGVPGKFDDTASLRDDIASEAACSSRDGRTEPSGDFVSSELNQLEYAEVTLVVEMSTDAETAQDRLNKNEVVTSPMNGPKSDENEDCETEFPDTNSAAPEMQENLGIAQDNATSASGHMHGLITNGSETTRVDTSEMSELKMESEQGFKPCKKRAVEELSEEVILQLNEFEGGPVNAERKKGRIKPSDSFQMTEKVGSEIQSSVSGTELNENTKVVEESETDLGMGPTAKPLEESSGGVMVQTELVRDSIDTPNGSVQKGPGKSECRRDCNHEETELARGSVTTAVVEMDSKSMAGVSHADVDSAFGIDHHRGIVVVRERVEDKTQGLSTKNDSGIYEEKLEKGPIQSYQEMEIDGELEGKQDVIEEEKSPHCNLAGNSVTSVLACHVEVCKSKESANEVKTGQEGLATPDPMLQDTQISAALSGSLPLLGFENGKAECTDMLQVEREFYQNAHPEMHIRLTETPHEGVQRSLETSSRVLSFASSREVGEARLSMGQHWNAGIAIKVKSKVNTSLVDQADELRDSFANAVVEDSQAWPFPGTAYNTTEHPVPCGFEDEKMGVSDEANTGTSEEERYFGGELEAVENTDQKRAMSNNPANESCAMNEPNQSETLVKKAKKKAVNVWAKTTSRKGLKKNARNGGSQNLSTEDSVLLTPVYANPDKVEDGPDQPIALSKYDKAEKIDLSENRLTASSTKGYRMVRATRGVQEGTWYYEIIVEQLGPTGHTRLGWSTQKGDVQAPVGFDSNSYGYRDLDGSKTHVAVREPYGDLYVEGDVIGFYIHLPNGAEYAPKPASLLSHRGRGPYLSDVKEEQPRRVPGSEICFFRNGMNQGTAFQNIHGGRYFPAASMYTLPKEPSCMVRFNFGPDFRYPPVDLDGRPAPMAMFYAPYHNALNGQEVGPVTYANVCMTEISAQNSEPKTSVL